MYSLFSCSPFVLVMVSCDFELPDKGAVREMCNCRWLQVWCGLFACVHVLQSTSQISYTQRCREMLRLLCLGSVHGCEKFACCRYMRGLIPIIRRSLNH
ncbi:hypothetical protein DUNSADRAFT_2136 [Dunaliella salina]|uniref:Secreted protein n=1 Tax=Dunaliella salina TaxID=3046 RepID=A0ABQ7H8B4_DUNSA|nr:hypothetical protein DUNSADRAFT_2136 [Dunaliella salina]|eukprot:KAF5843099.1 hypothetical protein DUNSADRAFT_2136 [Dunaliella salina]